MHPSKLSLIHKVTGDALDISIINMEEENFRLKETTRELEATVMPPPIFSTLFSMVQLGKIFQRTPESSLRLKGVSILLNST
jgi:hypothetical protein